MRLLPDPEHRGDVKQIALFACGNVRAALLDAQGILQGTFAQPELMAA